jgi:hypothetical protein
VILISQLGTYDEFGSELNGLVVVFGNGRMEVELLRVTCSSEGNLLPSISHLKLLDISP